MASEISNHPGAEIRKHFHDQFGAKPDIAVRAPGRTNLIGEHIDYNGGHVLPLAIDMGVSIAATARADQKFRLYSVQFNEVYEGDLRREKEDHQFWANYIFGVIREFEKRGIVAPGMDLVVDGNIPRGSGLSSSAGLEVATAWTLQGLTKCNFSRMDIARMCQEAENKFVGVNCGIMDQAISACGEEGHALLLDCNSLEYEQAPLALEGKAAILVAHSGVHRGLSSSAYNDRRNTCDQAFAFLKEASGEDYKCLCDVPLEVLEKYQHQMDLEAVKRARHAITEENRVKEAVRALREDDLEKVGQLLNASHASLRDDYAVSCDELDRLTEMVRQQPGALGSRLTGAGFGGCTVSLVKAEAAEAIQDLLISDYYEANNLEPVLFCTTARKGVHTL